MGPLRFGRPSASARRFWPPPSGSYRGNQPPGTINIVAFAPVRLSDAALVNAVATITEAKAQALWELGLAATGTATDAVTVLCPADGRPALRRATFALGCPARPGRAPGRPGGRLAAQDPLVEGGDPSY